MTSDLRRWMMLCEAETIPEKVFRVEHGTTKEGPYAADILPSPVRKPHPDADGMIGWEGKAFGFESMEQLMEWFSARQRAKLRANGYVVSVYEVRYAEYGISQVAFDMKAATLVDTLPIPK